jgi:hypothetical protein
MADLFWLTKAQIRRITHYPRFHTECRGWTTSASSAASCNHPQQAAVARRAGRKQVNGWRGDSKNLMLSPKWIGPT